MTRFKNIPVSKLAVIGILLLAAYNVYYTFNYNDSHAGSAILWWSPSWLLFGPFLYVATKSELSKRFVFHLLPPAFALLIYFVLPGRLMGWYAFFFFVIPLSMGGYIWRLLPRLKQQAMSGNEAKTDLFFLLAAFYTGLIAICAVRYVCIDILALQAGVNYYGYINYLLMAMAIFTGAFLIAKPGMRFESKKEEVYTYAKAHLREELAESYIRKIESYFKQEQPYLQYNITLDILSQRLAIPKPHLTQVFNVFFKKKFYSFLATYRIEYALQLMEESNMTIEAIAHESGFSSKTSFNNHFKAITGLTPTNYLNQRIKT